jgi:hypothetical protein
MESENKPGRPIDPNHDRKRSRLRRAGIIVTGCAILMMLVGFFSFVSSFGTGQLPHYVWCLFVGLPLLFFGLVFLQAGFAGAALRYFAGESAPVAKDSFNYVADGIKPGVKDIASAVNEGIAAGRATASRVACQKCQEPNDPAAKFCKQCGTPMTGSKSCPACNEPNAPDARFCDHCGHALVA